MVVTQHVNKIVMLSDAQSAQLQRSMDADKRVNDSREQAPAAGAASAATADTEEGSAADRMINVKPCTRSAHGTRGASNGAHAAVRQEEPAGEGEVVSAAFEPDEQWRSDTQWQEL